MDVKEKLVELILNADNDKNLGFYDLYELTHERTGLAEYFADYLIARGVTVQECAYWQYIEDDVDEDNNIQAYCSVCGAGDRHATSMIEKVPYCWKCGRKMMPQPPKGE